MDAVVLESLRTFFGERLRENVPLAPYTSARIGGPADVLIDIRSSEELAWAAQTLWAAGIPWRVLGGGSNVLVSDRGVRGVVLLNRARRVCFRLEDDPPTVWAESGATLNDLAQRAARQGLSGLEWAASVPGSLGGAVYGNAGAFGGDMAGNLLTVEILHRDSGRQTWPVEKMEYGYRTSVLKRDHPPVVILAATLRLQRGDPQAIRLQMQANHEQRRRTQPPGASMGSMFKNPPGDKAGRLIEAAGLKGTRIGGAEISPMHANFFINTEHTRAADMKALLQLAQRTVFDKFGVWLEPEIEMIGDWDEESAP
ncbi:MAG: UDP-N-acetylmuramate dehydrogenase [Anaerolineales bacterium]|nr:UDP-N-acetylmuramate dehydrogenase [Anaerolineales bacterium]MCX7607853.1 UDP-N-acetylmuramate dehydrogenase [Anaerolineales bacterium]MDW8227863.1 UDP-N-acetylmuramate dehydrogenase [Anaerolineales bacterium]